MVMVKNVDYDKINISIIEGDTLDKSWSVYYNNALYDMTGMQLDMEVKDEDDVLVATLTSAGASPSITITTSTMRLYKDNFIGTAGNYFYDIQLTNGTKVSTICRGKVKVIKEYTD